MENNRNKKFTESLLSELSCDLITFGEKVCIKYSRDIINLLEEKRLAALDPQFVKDITSSLSVSDDMPQMSDEQLQMFCKSRYINNLTDVSSFSEGVDLLLEKYGKDIETLKREYHDSVKNSSIDGSKSDS